MLKKLLPALLLLFLLSTLRAQTIYPFTIAAITGDSVSLSEYEGKVVLIVNVASECGLTPQYKDLQALYETYEDRGLVVLGFPANDFGGQEPGSEAEIAQFCTANYGVTFPMFSKIAVTGEERHPLYDFLTQKSANGVLDTEMKWNFQKFLVGKDGKLAAVFMPRTRVNEAEVMARIEGELGR